MERYLCFIQGLPLFAGIGLSELPVLLGCLGAQVASFPEGSYPLWQGTTARNVGILLSGTAQQVQDDYMGRRTLLKELHPGSVYAETFACARVATASASIQALENCEILLLDYSRITTSCSSACAFHARLIANMMALLAQNNLALESKLLHISRRTTREKLLSYLSAQARQAGSRYFTIPFNRQQLADYLCVDRSALSSELGRLRDEGILSFYRSDFALRGAELPGKTSWQEEERPAGLSAL